MKQISINNLFDYSIVISVNNNQLYYFYDNIKKTFSENVKLPIAIPSMIGHYPIIKDFTEKRFNGYNVLNCMLSHIQAVNIASGFNWPYLTLFEDDAFFNTNTNLIQFQTVLNNIPDSADMITLGYTHGYIQWTNNKDKTEYFVKSSRNRGSHAELIFKSGYKKYKDIANNEIHSDMVYPSFNTCWHTLTSFFIQSRVDGFNYSITHVNEL